jgi:hypothetical protein
LTWSKTLAPEQHSSSSSVLREDVVDFTKREVFEKFCDALIEALIVP